MEKYKISKEKSTEIKGIGILLMLLHHFFTFPDWYIKNYGFDISTFASIMREPTKICVAVFAFITGYVLCIKPLTRGAIIKKIIKFLVAYWMVYIPLLIASIIIGYRTSVKNIVLEAFGIHVPIMIFGWYVYFYIISIILISLTRKGLNKSIIHACIIGIVCPMWCFFALKKIFYGGILENFFYHLAQWYPCISMGYISNRYNVFSYLKETLKNVKGRKVILFGIMLFSMSIRLVFDKLDFIYVLFLVFSACELLEYSGKIGSILKKWGAYQCLFGSYIVLFFQKL